MQLLTTNYQGFETDKYDMSALLKAGARVEGGLVVFGNGASMSIEAALQMSTTQSTSRQTNTSIQDCRREFDVAMGGDIQFTERNLGGFVDKRLEQNNSTIGKILDGIDSNVLALNDNDKDKTPGVGTSARATAVAKAKRSRGN